MLSPIFGASSGWTWALTIVFLVVLMRLIMVPLFIKQMHTTRRMTALAPQMTALRKKYKNDKQTLNNEMMKLYQEAGVNPLMGCLPVVAQLPMFFALFSVLRAISLDEPKYGLTPAMMAERPARQDPRCDDRGQVPVQQPAAARAGRGQDAVICLRPDQHDDDVPDRAAEHEARHDAPGTR